jgi:hypothetical protein
MNRIWEDSRTDCGWPLVTPKLPPAQPARRGGEPFGVAHQFAEIAPDLKRWRKYKGAIGIH